MVSEADAGESVDGGGQTGDSVPAQCRFSEQACWKAPSDGLRVYGGETRQHRREGQIIPLAPELHHTDTLGSAFS